MALSVFQGVVDEVKTYRTQTSADRFVSRFEKDQGIKNEHERQLHREYKDTYAAWYECDVEE